MKHPSRYRKPLIGMLLALLVAACDDSPKTFDACMLKASRQSQNDRQFKQMSEACKAEFPNR